MSKSETCLSCRFWLIDTTTNGGQTTVEDGDIAFGHCRRNAPVVIGELAALMVPRQTWRRDLDHDQDVHSTCLYSACTQPVTEASDWCGEYQKGEGR